MITLIAVFTATFGAICVKTEQSREVTAKEISEELSIPYPKINHYTNLGLFSIVRKDGNKRLYDREEVELRYQTISKLANEGYPLGLIRKMLMNGGNRELL